VAQPYSDSEFSTVKVEVVDRLDSGLVTVPRFGPMALAEVEIKKVRKTIRGRYAQK
jgi:hypothetical protein